MYRQALLLVAAGLSISLAPAQARLTTETVEARDGKSYDLDFGRLDVPENRGVEGSRSISLAFVRARSPLENPGPPVFLLAGGPGGSGIDMVRRYLTGGGRMFLETFGGDVVGIDQRGVGRSEPNLETATSYGLSVEEPGDRERQLELILEVCRAEAARWRAKGVDLAGYTTAESADDVDAVRRALGYDEITLFGSSYGSHLALATLRRHEAHIARAVLIGPEGPDHTIKLPSYAESGLQRLAELVRADAAWRERLPDLMGSVEAVLERLAEEPVFVDVDGTRVGVGRFDVQQLLANAIGFRSGLQEVPATVDAMANGDFSTVARQLLEERRQAGIGSVMQAMMDSASGLSPARAARIAAQAPECLLGDVVDFPFPHVAAAWGAPDLGDAYRGPLRSEVPVLFIVGDLDTRTPVGNAEELMRDLPNAHLIVVENVGHDTPLGHPDLRAAWSGFLAGRDVELTRVAAPPPKFAPPAAKDRR